MTAQDLLEELQKLAPHQRDVEVMVQTETGTVVYHGQCDTLGIREIRSRRVFVIDTNAKDKIQTW